MLARVRSWMNAVIRRQRLERELAEELDFHLASRADDLIRGGLSRAEARRQAHLEFGAGERYKEECRESHGLRLVNELRADVLYAARGLRRTPGFAAVVVLSLALGIGANSAMFSIVNGVLLRPLPYRDQERLVVLQERMPESLYAMKSFRIPPVVNALLHRDELHSFEDMLAMDHASYQLVDAAEPEDLQAGWVTANMCAFLGVQPVAGRCFTAEEEARQAPVTLLSYALWQRQFGGDPNVVGRAVPLRAYDGDKFFTVVGVLPPQFRLVWKLELWMPLSESRNYRTRNAMWSPALTIARLKPGTGIGQARAEFQTMQRRIFPKEYEGAGGNRIVVMPIVDFLTESVKTGLTILLAVVGLVLLITCANVSNLLLSRGAGRVREMAVRASLGAGRSRVCRQLLTEALVLAALGGALGLVVAAWVLKGAKALALQRVPRLDEIHIDWTVFAFTALVSVLCGMLFGWLPSLRLSRLDLADAMKAGGTGAIGGRRQQRVMASLVVFEIALCVVAMMSAGLLINTFVRLREVDPGFRADHVLVASLNPRVGAPDSATQSLGEVLERVRSIPGVLTVGLSDNPPPAHVRSIQDFKRPGTLDAFGPGGPRANSRVVSPGYFQAMGIPILRGRAFDSRDQSDSPRVIVISEGMARRYWPHEDPIGKTIILRDYRKEVTAGIAGVARDVRQTGPRNQPDGLIYSTYSQADLRLPTLLIRTKADPASMAPLVRHEIRAVDRTQTLRTLTTMDRLLAGEVAEPRLYMVLLGGYGALALALTAIGVAGLVAYAVSRRTQEIGLRISFGASRPDLLRMFAAGSLKLVGAGLVTGIPVALAVTRFTRSLLYEIGPADPATLAMVAVVLMGVSLAACGAAAFRATTIEPTVVLRQE